MKITNPTDNPLFLHSLGKMIGAFETIVVDDAEKAEALVKTGVLKAVEDVRTAIDDVTHDKPEPAQRTEQVQGSQLVETDAAPPTENR